MGCFQRSLFPHLNECLPAPLTEQEKRLVSILEIFEAEWHVPRIITRYRYPGRKPLHLQALARVFVAKALYHYPTTSDLHRALQSTANLRKICGFGTAGSLPSEPLFRGPSQPLPLATWGYVVYDALVAEYPSHELIGHISRDSTAIVGREKPAKKATKKLMPRRKRGRPAKGEQLEATTLTRLVYSSQ